MFARRESLKQYLRLYPVNSVIIVINLLVMAAMEWYGSSLDDETLFQFGAMFSLPGLQPEWWRYITSVFVHIGFEHLLFNGFALYVFAAPLERMLGAWRYVLFYIASGVAGSLASQLLHSDPYIGAGASGAIYGIYAAYLYLSVFRKDLVDYETKTTIRTILIIGVIYSFVVPNVDMYAHAGGFVGGLVMMGLLSLAVRRKERGRAVEPQSPEESTQE
jgi:rhomboid protease GluP